MNLVFSRVEGPQKHRRLELEIGWRHMNFFAIHRQHIEFRSQTLRSFIQHGCSEIVPSSRIQTADQRLESDYSLSRGELAVSGAMHKQLAQKLTVVLFINHVLISALIFNHHQAVAFGMQSQHGDVDLPVENNVVFEISES